MKKVIEKQISVCDVCLKEDVYVRACLNCGKEMCWECQKKSGVEYSGSVYFSGSGDGFYCTDCNRELSSKANNPIHNAYKHILRIKEEHKAWSDNFEERRKQAEQALRDLMESF